MSNIMLSMARNDALYHPEKYKLIGVNIDPSAFVDEKSGELDSAALAHEGFEWVQKQFKKLDAEKAAEVEAKKAKDEAGEPA
jgi:hypothetical protein